MGAGREKETCTLPEKSHPRSTVNCRDTARNLRTTDLGGVIFGCKNSTMKECLTKKLFGLPAPHFSYVKNVKPRMPLFLFNYNDRKLHGIFEAVSQGKLNIDPYGWAEGDSEGTPYPAQVKFRIQMYCKPLYEDQFGPVVSENYYEAGLFWFELDHEQTKRLVSLFASASISANNFQLGKTEKQRTKLKSSGTSEEKQGSVIIKTPVLESEISYPPQAKAEWSSLFKTASSRGDRQILESPATDRSPENSGHTVSNSGLSYSAVVKKMSASATCNDLYGDSNKSYSSIVRGKDISFPQKACSVFQTGTSSTSVGDLKGLESAALKSKLPPPSCPSEEWDSKCIWPHISDAAAVDATKCEEHLENLKPKCEVLYSAAAVDTSSSISLDMSHGTSATAGSKQESEHFNKAALEVDSSSSSSNETYMEWVNLVLRPHLDGESESSGSPSHVATVQGKGKNILYSENVSSSGPNVVSQMDSFGMQSVINQLMQEVAKLTLSQLQSVQKVNTLEQELVESKKEIRQLKNKCRIFNVGQPEAIELESMPGSKIADSILIMGGFDGTSWLSDVELYSPSRDIRKPICTMRSTRSYTSSVMLNGDVYVIGGGNDRTWYDIVESYNLVSNRWVSCPSLSQRKGSVAGVSLNEKIFALGGGNGVTCLPDVEVLDVNIGKWIRTRSMLNKRFAAAAAELNGMLYIAGGYDGNNYLKSAERFDIRNRSWGRIGSMSTARACYSLAVLNQKLYAIGGYDGNKMVSTVEVYEPRMAMWMMAESMSDCKGYYSSAVLGDLIYVIGGLMDDGHIVDNIECYKEGFGWQITNLKSIGKRAFSSAVVP